MALHQQPETFFCRPFARKFLCGENPVSSFSFFFIPPLGGMKTKNTIALMLLFSFINDLISFLRFDAKPGLNL